LRFDISILPRIIVPTILFTGWASIWTSLYMIYDIMFLGVWVGLVMVASVVISLLLVFRTNTAYERYVSFNLLTRY
jgi:putative membrane protein